ncbi:TetR family transcriptional regulator [Streptomyces bottropensis]|uniref:TetR family transcriptional regulator n=1 Tax=Streptomyces bottropensis TaxID=42235 RepID=UPI0036B75B11
MTSDSSASRARLLDAAASEFSAHGLAGARVARIASSAKLNKERIYAYFGDKEGLFDAVMDQRHVEVMAAVPLNADDLPGYVGRLFDYIISHPDLMRLAAWKQLERPLGQNGKNIGSYEHALAPLTAARDEGRIDTTFNPVDLAVILYGLASAWHHVFAAQRDTESGTTDDIWSAQRLTEHREALIEVVRRLMTS